MKLPSYSAILMALLFSSTLHAQSEPADSTGLPGDHFSLEGAVELFKKSDSPEDFEKRLNSEDNHVNNLDLNEDGQTDYVRVVCYKDGDDQVLVLQAPLSEKDAQDIATIEIEKQGTDQAVLQILGDEDVFGEQRIVEPFEEDAVKSSKNRGGPAPLATPLRVVVNVWLWPSVRFMYAPGYRVWVSPWRWAYYPAWWRPWRPHPFYRFRVWTRPHYAHCHVVTTHRVVRAHAVYAPRRTHSTVVHTRTTTTVTTRRAHGTTVNRRTTTTTKTKAHPGGGHGRGQGNAERGGRPGKAGKPVRKGRH